ncbi:hypothetical protein K431DRAFT_335698 [Polychaeton citri CBS 116435]|uniref:C2 domain-containing protein n=1 Tax=Polychaeton citri CBS 116435 TaxID=1314669 RepID=A0A9P4QFE4_9PEZI|nr:hypothetical protein K431DRAFT_335698 [Polychaeton citri CBS 116435]
MATKQAVANGPLTMNISGHAAGIFADMTVDGPEIGTLVLIVDRAKNLPNRKTMGKQNPYCAVRLGKEAKKTETDKRGGQTPRWDQELRFTIHDSPDYHQLKMSVFSEDKRTDLIGEAWVNLADVVTPGGGKSDVWQGLNCKGKYAGEIRLELTYYDTRPKPEGRAIEDAPSGLEKPVSSSSKVKRRPLPTGPAGPMGSKGLTPATIPDATNPGRAKHGPREYKQPSTKVASQHDSPSNAVPALSGTPAAMPQPVHAAQLSGHVHPHTVSAPMYINQHIESQHTSSHHPHPQQYSQSPEGYHMEMPDFLPELPTSSRQRTAMPERYAAQPDPAYADSRNHSQSQSGQMAQPRQHQQEPPPLSHSHSAPLDHESMYPQHPQIQTHRADHPPPLQHSYSAPVVPHPEDPYSQYNKYSDSHAAPSEAAFGSEYQHQPPRHRRHEIPPGWHDPYEEPQHYRQPYVEDEEASSPPPPPPAHSSSTPAIPQYDASHNDFGHSQTPVHATTPSSARRQYVNDQPALQDMERRYLPSQYTTPNRHPARAQSMDAYGSSPTYNTQQSTPASLVPGQRQSPTTGPSPTIQAQRHSVIEPYRATPSRPHPLSQEVPRARSPLPSHEQRYLEQTPPNQDLPYQEYRGRDLVPLVKPRAISPSPARPALTPQSRSSYDIQFPVRAFESSDDNPLSTSNRQTVPAKIVNRSTPTRKSVSPRPTPPGSESRTSVPFSPDSYEIHNPSSRSGGLPSNSSPYNPYQIRPGSEQDQRSGPITGWDGREIDPSDHLPVDSWAPEPEKKTPAKTYGLGRDRDFGPRTKEPYHAGAGTSSSVGHRLSKDTVINFRPKPAPETDPMLRNRLQKRASGMRDAEMEPLRERHNYNNTVPNPYEQQEFSRRFHEEGAPSYSDGPYVLQHERGYSLPAIPPKVPMQQSREQYANPSYAADYGTDALSREIGSIDIDAGRRRSRPGNSPLYVSSGPATPTGGSNGPSPTHYVPVRSHRDRNTVYY